MSTRHSFLSTTGLIRPPSVASVAEEPLPFPYRHARSGGTKPRRRTPNTETQPANKPLAPLPTRAGIVPLGPAFLIGIAVLLSLLFTTALSCAFIPDEDERPFAAVLENAAANTPGIVLIGDDVDVDIDEPAITIRWSIIACGPDFVLPGSEGTHGSLSCGLPVMPLAVFVDGDKEPATTYDPSLFPFLIDGGQRNRRNMFQFDDDHVLDVHQARNYPFDTYVLTSSLRAVSTADNASLPIQRLSTISLTSSFVVTSSDTASYLKGINDTQEPSRDLTLQVVRPAEARMYALLLFGISWMLAHATMALVVFSWNLEGAERLPKYLASTFIVILLIPQLRNAMPDGPDFDGESSRFYDSIGFFPQMLVSAVSAIMLIAMMVKREIQAFEDSVIPEEVRKEAPGPISAGLLRMRRGGASVDINHVRNLSRSLSVFGRS
ncbi:hypothetical protein C8Q78DRAFT_1129732 [Trametes maxima]|nr:hypothetical protein C8Q78DRAFT_1129732 [Trametes maxima]